MITTNVFFRTFLIEYGDERGTAFSVDYENREYLVTAAHVVDGIEAEDRIKIFLTQKWMNLPVAVGRS